ncbi:MAG TPA: hypothetical protein VNL95_06260 [Dehalococcoidia bacterium]|nr:hypothetical protein [Dehalococcoidia bacterium]
MKRWLLGVALAAAVLFGSLGAMAVASAQDGSGSGGFSFAGTFLDRLAQKLGIGRDQLVQAMRDAANETIDQAVQEGRLTQDQAQRLRDRIAQTEPGFPWGRHGGRWAVKAGHGVVLQSAAQVLGMSTDDLTAQLRQGKSLAQVAQEHGISTDDFKSRLLSQVDQQLSQLVQQGRLTQQQADQLKQRIHDNIDAIVNAQGRPCPTPSGTPQTQGTGTTA